MNDQKTCAGEVFKDLKKFDSDIRKIIPYYDLALEEVTRHMDADSENILELGSGTGELSLRILQKYPKATLWALDYSERMNSRFKEKLAEQNWSSRVKLLHFDILNIDNALENGHIPLFDGCASSFTIHHLPDMDKQTLIHRIAKLLKPGGGLWIADSMFPESTMLEERYTDARRRWMQSFDLEENSILKQMVLKKPFGKSEDHYHAPLQTHLQMFEKAGFESVYCPFKYYGIAVCGGVMPETV